MADSTKVRVWLQIGLNDLQTAKAVAAAGDIGLSGAIYHLQQAGEKAVKAFLVAREQPFEKIHDIERLIATAAALDPRFLKFSVAGADLTPLGTVYRYPQEVGFVEPTREEFEKALEDAQAIYDFVLRLVPPEACP